MKTCIYESEALAGAAVAQAIGALVQKKPDAVLCVAAGHTSLPVFQSMIEAQHTGWVDYSQVRFVELDEWLGMDASDPEGCTGFLMKNLFVPLEIRPEQLYLFDGKSAVPAAECEKMEQVISLLGGIDYMMLGMGQNGHLGLNEPGCDFEAGVHTTALSDKTKQVGQKYFSSPANLVGGITLGVRNLLACREISLLVTGAHKQRVVAEFYASAIDSAMPASVLKGVERVEVYLDAAAAAGIRDLEGI